MIECPKLAVKVPQRDDDKRLDIFVWTDRGDPSGDSAPHRLDGWVRTLQDGFPGHSVFSLLRLFRWIYCQSLFVFGLGDFLNVDP